MLHAEVERAGLGVLEVGAAGPGDAIGNRMVIERARGLLMSSLGCDAKDASRALVQISWDHDTSVLNAALAMVAAAEDARFRTDITELAATTIRRARRSDLTVGERVGMETV